MIITFLLSFIVTLAVDVFCMYCSGGNITGFINGFEFPGIILLLVCFLFLSGYGKDFCRIFSSPSKEKKLLGSENALKKLRATENSLDFASKSIFYICLFFTLIAGIYFYINIDYLTALGSNLATVLLSLFYMCFFFTIFTTLKAKLRNQIINYMAEKEPVAKSEKPTTKAVIAGVIKVAVVAVLIVAMTWGITAYHTMNLQDTIEVSPLMFVDLPSILYLILHCFLLILVSGNLMVFLRGFRAAFKNQKISVADKNLFMNAVRSFRMIMICSGAQCMLEGFIGVLFNLEDRKYLGLSMFYAMIPVFYAIILCVVLVLVESRISKLCDE